MGGCIWAEVWRLESGVLQAVKGPALTQGIIESALRARPSCITQHVLRILITKRSSTVEVPSQHSTEEYKPMVGVADDSAWPSPDVCTAPASSPRHSLRDRKV